MRNLECFQNSQHNANIVEEWIAWMSKEVLWWKGYYSGYLEVNKEAFKLAFKCQYFFMMLWRLAWPSVQKPSKVSFEYCVEPIRIIL
jgi:hypothetical protein